MEYSEVKELIEIFEKTDLNDMELTLGNDSLRLNRGRAPQFPVAMPPQAVLPPQAAITPQMSVNVAAEQERENGSVSESPVNQSGQSLNEESAKKSGQVITAPIVGTFYQSQAPGEPPFVRVGDKISAGDVVCIIEAMKFMNEVNSDISGTITEILAEDGAFVEYGQELFRVE